MKESTAGEAAKLEIGQLPEFGAKMWVEVNGKKIDLPKKFSRIAPAPRNL